MKYFFTFIFLISTFTFGCSCGEFPSVKNSFDEFDEIIIGKVIKIDATLYDYSSNPVFAYTFEIEKNFKKNIDITNKKQKYYTTIYTPASSMFGGCGSNFELNETYLIYGFITDFSIYTNICTRTSDLKFVEQSELEELKKLSKEYLKKNTLNIPPPPNSSKENLIQKEFELYKLSAEKRNKYYWIGLSLLGFLLTISIFFNFRKRK